MAQNECKFVYTRKEAEDEGVRSPKDLPNLIEKAIPLARAPISGFNVGVVGLTNDGRVFLGVNVEFPNLPLHHSIHSEQFLLTNIVLNSAEEESFGGKKGIHKLTHIVVSADGTNFDSPCGHCLQFYQEMGNPPQTKILIKKEEQGINEFMKISSLIPRRFGPDSILPKDASLVLQQRSNNLSGPRGTMLLEPDDQCLQNMALYAANKSYAPYSKCPSGVALITGRGDICKGWYIESVAFNPSVGPLQAALVDLVARGGNTKFNEITKVVLVEKKDAKVRQEATARIILNEIAPTCKFEVYHCRKETEQD